MARKFHQGIFTPRNPEKYVGNVHHIVYRSGWEKKVMLWLDNTPSVLKWSSEEVVIPYRSPIDNRIHRYFIDFVMQYKSTGGEMKVVAIEVKPKAQTLPPKVPKKQTKYFMESVETYEVNKAKWAAAIEWCSKRGWGFQILTEEELFGKG